MATVKNLTVSNSSTKTETEKSQLAKIITTFPPIQVNGNSQKTVSVQDKIHELDILFSHRDKWQRLNDAKNKLKKFEISDTTIQNQIDLRDDDGNTFKTSNPVVLKKVIAWLLEDLEVKIKEVETKFI